MANYKFLTVFIVLSLFMDIHTSCQEVQTLNPVSIIAGSDRNFIINFHEGESVKAKILSINDEKITIREKGENTRTIDRKSISDIEEIPFGTLGTAGVGFGIPYGTLGFNLEIGLLPYLSVTGGLGTTIFTGIGYSAGLKAYFRRPGKTWRPRASVYYGINAVYAEDFNHPANKKYSGWTVGAGQIFLWQHHGFDLDLMYIINSPLWDEYPGEYRKFKISLGYRYAF
jgi:hypothetical protein